MIFPPAGCIQILFLRCPFSMIAIGFSIEGKELLSFLNKPANSFTELYSKRLDIVSWLLNLLLIFEISLIANRECPPISKKLASIEMVIFGNNSLKNSNNFISKRSLGSIPISSFSFKIVTSFKLL